MRRINEHFPKSRPYQPIIPFNHSVGPRIFHRNYIMRYIHIGQVTGEFSLKFSPLIRAYSRRFTETAYYVSVKPIPDSSRRPRRKWCRFYPFRKYTHTQTTNIVYPAVVGSKPVIISMAKVWNGPTVLVVGNKYGASWNLARSICTGSRIEQYFRQSVNIPYQVYCYYNSR